MTSIPTIAIIDWTTAPQGDPESTIERKVIGLAAHITQHLCETDADLPDEISVANAIILWHNMPLTEAAIAKMKNCRAIIRNGVGFDSVDIAAARRCGIAVCNVPDYGTEEVADHTIALTMALCRQLFPLDAEAKQLGWQIRVMPRLRRLRELTFGVVGLGRIGTATALRAKALGFRIVFHDPYVASGMDKALGITRLYQLDELLAQSDVVSLHCPLNEETHHLITKRELAFMKPGSFIVNTARGAIIEKSAVLAALRSGHLAGAGLDVIEHEPLRSIDDATTPNLIATCHAAFCSVESRLEMRNTSAQIALAAVTGKSLQNVVNKLPN